MISWFSLLAQAHELLLSMLQRVLEHQDSGDVPVCLLQDTIV